MTSVPPIQEMPPVGGYASILTNRVPSKRFWNGRKALAIMLFAHLPAICYRQFVLVPARFKRDLERRDCCCVVQPLLKAERSRAKLIRVHENIKIETELMKDVPGWEVGTWYGEKMYKTTNEWENPLEVEYYIHSDLKDFAAFSYDKDCFEL